MNECKNKCPNEYRLFTSQGQINFWHYFDFIVGNKLIEMENRKESSAERRRRKVMSRPVLVRSEKPGQVAASANYSDRRQGNSIWREA